MARTAYLFAGQGAQTLGMGQDLCLAEPAYRKVVEYASSVLDIDLTNAEVAAAPENTQVAILTMSYGIWRLIANSAADPVGFAGLSLGEYSALVAADALSFGAALKLVSDRSRYMAAAGAQNPGKMAAVLTADHELVEALCARIGDVYVANYNTPTQLVVGGTPSAVSELRGALKAQKIRMIPLKVAVSSHTPMMAPAANQLAERVASVSFKQPEWPVWSNTTAAPFEATTLAQTLVDQLTEPTHFDQDLRGLLTAGVDQFVEIGPGHVLSGFAKQAAPDVARTQLNDLNSLTAFRHSLGG